MGEKNNSTFGVSVFAMFYLILVKCSAVGVNALLSLVVVEVSIASLWPLEVERYWLV